MPRFSVITSLSWKQYAVIAALLIAGGGWVFVSRASSGAGQTTTVRPADFLEQIVVAGEVKPAQQVDLGFEQGGRINAVYVSVGDVVPAGTTLSALSSAELSASVSQKEASLEMQKAKLDGLKAGALPEDIAASQAAVDKAQQDLANMYAGLSDTLAASYAKGVDAVRTQLDPLFSAADTSSPQLTYSTSNSQSAITASTERLRSGVALRDWQNELITISPMSDVAMLERALGNGVSRLSVIRTLVEAVIDTLNGGTNLSAATLASHKTAATDALTEVTTATTNLNTALQNIASQKKSVQQLQSQLDLKRTGSSSHDIAAQQAAVDAAEADVASARAQLAKAFLRAPISGTVTKVDAKVGQVAGADSPVISMISSGIFQIESFIPEVDIAQVNVGDSASTTLDAYGPDVVFAARVISIDPAQTVKNGVSTYKTTLQFDSADPRIRSGMTANTTITTSRVQDALSVPRGAVFRKDGRSYVQVEVDKAIVNRAVQVGTSSSQLGNVRIVSGLEAGDVVLLNPDISL